MPITIIKAAQEFEAWLAVERGASPHTLEAYGRDIKAYREWLDHSQGVRDLECVSPDQPGRYLMGLAESGLAASSQARAAAAIRSFHRFCLREGLVATDLSSLVAMPLKPMQLPQALAIEAVAQLLDQPFSAGPAGIRDKAILELLYGTGLRVSELTGLDRQRVLLDEGYLRVIGKGSKERLTPFSGSAMQAMADYLLDGRPHLHRKGESEPRDGAAVFLNVRGLRLTRQAVFDLVVDYGRRVGIEGLHPHTLRHSYATHLLEGGADLMSIQELLGHASIATTQIYTSVDMSHIRAEYLHAHPRASL